MVYGMVRLPLWLTLLMLCTGAAAEFRYAATLPGDGVVVDTRTLEQCRTMSLMGARCLPATDLLGPHRRLPSFRDILWVFGTAGLRGDETLTVVGGAPLERDYVAALLYLAGQHEVVVLTEPVSRLIAAGAGAAPGMQRGMIRDPIYRAAMREHLLVLRDELWAELRSTRPPALFDGRSDAEYRGERVRAQRGGRLPGALSWPDQELRASLAREVRQSRSAVVAYGHDPLESLAYFTLLRAGARFDARVYFQGWRDWAARGELPVDHETLPEPVAATALPVAQGSPAARIPPWLLAVVALAVVVSIAVLFTARRSHRWTS